MIAALRPQPHRGDLLAAGGVVLAVAVGLVSQRMSSTWGKGVFLAVDGAAAALLLLLGLSAAPEWRELEQHAAPDARTAPSRPERRPRAYVGVLLLAGYGLGVLALVRLAEVLGADGIGSGGSAFWIFGALAAGALALWRSRRVAVFVLLGAAAAGASLVGFVSWAAHPHGLATYRWIAFGLLLAFTGGHVGLRETRRREAVLLADAAGLAALFLAVLLAGSTLLTPVLGGFDVPQRTGAPVGWAAVLLVAGCALVAFAALEREPGPGFIGAFVLAGFVIIVGVPGRAGASLVGWPIVLLVLAVVVIGAALRPTVPAPPEPGVGGPSGQTIPMPGQEPDS